MGAGRNKGHVEVYHPVVRCSGRAEGAGQGFVLPICPKVISSKHVKRIAWWLVSEEASLPDFEVARLYFFCLHPEMGRKHPPSYYKGVPTDPPSPPNPKDKLLSLSTCPR